MRTILLFVSLLLAGSADAANWYVRPGGAGSKTGTDWNNAWNLSGTGGIAWSGVSAGDTVWLAGGTYSTEANNSTMRAGPTAATSSAVTPAGGDQEVGSRHGFCSMCRR